MATAATRQARQYSGLLCAKQGMPSFCVAVRPLMGAFFLVMTQASTAACPADWQMEAGARVVQSDWREMSPQGAVLLRESGLLRGPALGVAVRCEGWRLALRGLDAAGTRDYAGQTQSGVPLTTESELRHSEYSVELGRALWEGVDLVGILRTVDVQRNILSTASANGYPERYRWTVAAMGARVHWPLGEYDALHLGVTWGAGQNQNMMVWLPYRDAATLPLGEINEMALSLAWQHDLAPHWALVTHWEAQQTRIGQGASTAIFRNGVPVGVAYQPQVEMTQQLLGVVLQYRWESR